MFKAECAAVLGAGFMGSRIAFLCAQQGIRTINIDISPKQLDRAKTGVEKILSQLLDRGKISAGERIDIITLLSYSNEIASVSDADVVIEAVPESLELKKSLLRQIESHCKPDAIILSNTSGLSITEIAKETSYPERIMGAHFFAPPHIMKLWDYLEGDS